MYFLVSIQSSDYNTEIYDPSNLHQCGEKRKYQTCFVTKPVKIYTETFFFYQNAGQIFTVAHRLPRIFI